VIAFSATPSYGGAAPSLHVDAEFKKRRTGKNNMFRNTSIRGNITFVITAFVVILLIVIGVSVGMLKLSNDGMSKMYEEDTRILVELKTSSELLQRVRVSLDSYHALYGIGDPEPQLLANARQDIKESDRQFSDYLSHQPSDQAVRDLSTQLQGKRSAFVKQAVLPAFDALEQMDFSAFKVRCPALKMCSPNGKRRAIPTRRRVLAPWSACSGQSRSWRLRWAFWRETF
jgi:Tar ligand binding domain homologue